MILVDSSVWIDYLQGRITAQTEKLDMLLGQEPLAIGDLILTEVVSAAWPGSFPGASRHADDREA